MAQLSTLQRVELRDVWRTEDQDFTPWLAQEENLKVLGDAIGLELELEAQEKNVGPFRADILCREVLDDSWVLIENQLERTDHTHLGQLMTYAAGLNTVTIVWISARFSEEHRAALDWLNEITEEKIKFFGLEVELWQIGDSLAAPKFNIVSKPNDWSRSVSSAARRISEDDLNPTKANYLRYWTAFSDFARENSEAIKPQRGTPQHWSIISIGRSGFNMAALGAVRDNWIAVELTMHDDDAKSYFHQLHKDKEQIETELGFGVDWVELPDKKSSRIRIYRHNTNPLDESSWLSHFQWFVEKLEAFDRVFRQRIKNLDAEDWPDDNE